MIGSAAGVGPHQSLVDAAVLNMDTLQHNDKYETPELTGTEGSKIASTVVDQNAQSVIERATETQKMVADLKQAIEFTVRISDIKMQSKKIVCNVHTR